MPTAASSQSTVPTVRLLVGQLLACGLALLVVIPAELDRLEQIDVSRHGWARWLARFNVDTTPYLILIVLAPVLWLVRRELFRKSPRWLNAFSRCLGQPDRNGDGNSGVVSASLLSLLVAGVSLAVSLRIASYPIEKADNEPFGQLPAAYHDEYSYLFQAKTFLAGRLWFPSHEKLPRLFDQMHVLNEGRFASRYFPGAGAWIAPWQQFEAAYWGHWLAGAITSALVFWTGRELANNGVGLVAGLVTALSPGMGLFSNLLLSHHPTLVGVSLFLFAFFRMQRTQRSIDAALAGLGLSYAMLCRPMTAAGVGLPFGLWFLWAMVTGRSLAAVRRRQAVCLAVPLLAGLGLIFVYNRAITGNGFTTPYQVYTDTYTPRHVYGFNNVERGERRSGPRVLENYDRWAKNLTLRLAAENVQNRLIASCQWTLGIIPLMSAAIVFLLGATALDWRWWLVFAAIVSLHLVHVPYWFDGIMHWHYVFETGPLWGLLFSAATYLLLANWRATQRPAMPLWWGAMLATAVAVAHVPLDPFWKTCLVEDGIEQIAYSRAKYYRLQKAVAGVMNEQPAIVLINPDPDDRHIDFVTNDPNLQAQVLYGRFRGAIPFGAIARAFPDRQYYLYHAKGDKLLAIEEFDEVP